MQKTEERSDKTAPVPYSALVAFTVFAVMIGTLIGWEARIWLVEKKHQMEDGREVSRHDMSKVR